MLLPTFTFQASGDYFPPRISIKWKFLAKVREMLPNQFLMLFTVQNSKSLTKVENIQAEDIQRQRNIQTLLQFLFVCLFP